MKQRSSGKDQQMPFHIRRQAATARGHQASIGGFDALAVNRPGKFWLVLFISAVLSTAWITPAVVSETVAWMLVKEDGFYENCSFLLLAGASVFFLLASIGARKSRAGIWYFFFFLMTFFGAGEEISWGQRIFGWSVSEASTNIQGETTIHNLPVFDTVEGGLLKMSRLFMLFCLGWGLVLPVIYRFVPYAKLQIDRFQVPVIPITIGVFFLINIIASKVYQFTIINPYVERIAEVREASQAILLFAASIWFFMSTEKPSDLHTSS